MFAAMSNSGGWVDWVGIMQVCGDMLSFALPGAQLFVHSLMRLLGTHLHHLNRQFFLVKNKNASKKSSDWKCPRQNERWRISQYDDRKQLTHLNSSLYYMQNLHFSECLFWINRCERFRFNWNLSKFHGQLWWRLRSIPRLIATASNKFSAATYFLCASILHQYSNEENIQ